MLYLMECMRNFGNGTAKAMNSAEKECFFRDLRMFAEGLTDKITQAGKWNIRGFIDIFRNVYALSSDSKVLSKVLELHLLPELMNFAESIGYDIEPAEKQNWYPDFTFISRTNPSDKPGSGNTANIGSIQYINDILNGNGVFARAGEELFNDYWANFGRIKIIGEDGSYQSVSSLAEYLKYRGLPENL